MIQKTDLELEKSKAVKSIRANIRLHYSLQADEAINKIVPEWEFRIDAALQSGRSIDVSLPAILKELEDL